MQGQTTGLTLLKVFVTNRTKPATVTMWFYIFVKVIGVKGQVNDPIPK